MTDGHEANLICLDLAGSEGLTAVTPEFIKKVGKTAGKLRLMEGGAINYGLQQMQGLLREIGTKKGIEKTQVMSMYIVILKFHQMFILKTCCHHHGLCILTQGTGLRKLLHKYLQYVLLPLFHTLFRTLHTNHSLTLYHSVSSLSGRRTSR